MTAALAEAPIRDEAQAVAAQESWQLVQRAQAGDMDAYAALYTQHQPRILRYMSRHVMCRATAEDLASETFLRALRRIDTFSWQGRDFGAFLTTIAHNLIADHFKSGRFRLEYICPAPHAVRIDAVTGRVAPGSDTADQQPGPEQVTVEHLTRVDAHTVLLDVMAQLTPEHRRVIVLRFFDGLSVADTATAMGRSVGAIKSLQGRAVQAMRRRLPEGFWC